MNALRKIVLAGTVAAAAALSAGTAGAASSGPGLDAPPAIETAATPLFNNELCSLPRYQLVHRFGRVRAEKIIRLCNG